jgi:branched-chain amino acid transport system substrate-binding protein
MRAIAAFLFASGLWSAVLICPVSSQQPEAPLKIGLLDDFSSVYSHIGGVMDLEAAKMAIEDFGGVMFGKPIQLVSADALNKPDIAASIARKWWETEGVDMIVGLPTSATALAVMQASKHTGQSEAPPLHRFAGKNLGNATREGHDRERCGEFRHHRKILLALHGALDL